MFKVRFKATADKKLSKLPKNIQIRIIHKLEFFVQSSDPLLYAEPLTNLKIGTYRFRIGNYRVVFDMVEEAEANIIMILDIGHRKDIYRR
ncbi:type II toxin-antitoxin system RelE/ParE family toxin [Candidatus Daviesbacteria bacterium]|nr:type II toxin-antitoxin system RelE/ParE family toxin [Candidatus Daviesbacteria bacterium]